jgi:hypothetical protein
MSGNSMASRGDTIENSHIGHEFRFYGKGDAVLYVTFIVPTKRPADGLVLYDPKPKNCNVK